MASRNDSDSDSELIFEDAVEDITTSEQMKNNTSTISNTEKQEANTLSKPSTEESEKQTEGTCSAPELSKETVVGSSGGSVSDSLSNLNLEDHTEDKATEPKCDEDVQGESPKDNVDTKTDDEETESCSDSGEEFDEDTVDELMKEATEEQKDGPREEGESSEEEEEQDKVDEEELKERDATLTEEEKEELKDKAQNYKTEGNRVFKEGNYVASIAEYTSALQACPLCYAKERSIMYSNRGAAKLHLEKHEAAIADCSKAVELNPNYLKALLRRAELYEKTEKLDEALTDYAKVLEMDPSQHSAREAAMRLPDQIKERNEKMKDEMMGKLKDLGNMILKPFGLSTNNFQLQQDPNTGGYSVNFNQGAKQ